MSFNIRRTTVGDRLAAIASVLLVIDLFARPWFAYKPQFHTTAAMLGQRVSANGWQSFEAVGPLTLVVCAVAIAIPCLGATRRSPALPVVLTTLLLPVSLALVILLAIRTLLDTPSVHLLQAGGANALHTEAGAYVALGLSVAILVGLHAAVRHEGTAETDSPTPVETVPLVVRTAVGQPPPAARP